jgi:hypothetical protein
VTGTNMVQIYDKKRLKNSTIKKDTKRKSAANITFTAL